MVDSSENNCNNQQKSSCFFVWILSSILLYFLSRIFYNNIMPNLVFVLPKRKIT